MRDHEQFIAQVKYVLSYDGQVEVDGTDGRARVAFTTHDGRRFEFAASIDELYSHVELIDDEVLSDPTDSSPIQAQLRLFSVHVMEAVGAARVGATRFELREYGVDTV